MSDFIDETFDHNFRSKIRSKTIIFKNSFRGRLDFVNDNLIIEKLQSFNCNYTNLLETHQNHPNKKSGLLEIPEFFVLVAQAARLKSRHRDMISRLPVKKMFRIVTKENIPFFE